MKPSDVMHTMNNITFKRDEGERITVNVLLAVSFWGNREEGPQFSIVGVWDADGDGDAKSNFAADLSYEEDARLRNAIVSRMADERYEERASRE